MLDFIFRYTWLAMLVIAYIIWTIMSIKDILSNKDKINKISPLSGAWIMSTLWLFFFGSMIYWAVNY